MSYIGIAAVLSWLFALVAALYAFAHSCFRHWKTRNMNETLRTEVPKCAPYLIEPEKIP